MIQGTTIPVWRVVVDSGSARERERQVIEIAGENAYARAEARFREHVLAAQSVVSDALVTVNLTEPHPKITGMGYVQLPGHDLLMAGPIAVQAKVFRQKGGESPLTDTEIFDGPDASTRAQERWRLLTEKVDELAPIPDPATGPMLISVVLKVQSRDYWTFKRGYAPALPAEEP